MARDHSKEGFLNTARAPKPEGHELLVIMNGSRLVDTSRNGEWVSSHVGSGGDMPKGIYDLTGAQKPDKTAAMKTYQGNVMHIDKAKNAVYQLDSSSKKPTLVKHDLSVFRDKQPAIGSMVKIEYTRGQAQVADQERSRER
ncbi:KfrB domain-containing protein [Pseudomonas syringae]|uniref:KfrB domain-containing protein n=1 Tax=Pseudomonas syringae TaxID=317 RepID=UPI000465E774|nr:KfrB domain-containing protein [Pseudomonas syringae]QGG78949.1 hypothetical protein N028_26870 [Pseudomonas syringae USA011]